MYIEAQLRTVKQQQNDIYVIYGRESRTTQDLCHSPGSVRHYFTHYIRKHLQAKYAFGETCLTPDMVQPDHQMSTQKYGEMD